jgi:hypothetical protein
MDNLSTFGLTEELESLFDIGTDAPGSAHDRSKYDESADYTEEDEEAEESEYNTEFEMAIPVLYKGHEKAKHEQEYNELGLEDGIRAKDEDIIKDADAFKVNLTPAEDTETVEYRSTLSQAYHAGLALSYEGVQPETLLNIEYETPELINGQKTYQRIVFEADADRESVYELSVRRMKDAGIEFSSEYDGEFGSMLFTSINKRAEGEGGNFNEFYLNGEIGGNAADAQKVKKGDVIEWRYAEETDGSCGGVPDFSQVKAMLGYSTAANAYAASMGMGTGSGLPGTIGSFQHGLYA